MSDGDGLDPKNLDDLIAQLSRCQKAAHGDRIPARDVKEILQQAGLLESLLQEHPGSEGTSEVIEPQSSRRKSPFKKRFFALAIAAIGFSGIVGYNIGADHAISNANSTDVRKYTSNEKSSIGATKIGDAVGSTRAYMPDFMLVYQGCGRLGASVKCSVEVSPRIEYGYRIGGCDTDKYSHSSKLFDSKGGVYNAALVDFGGDSDCLSKRLLRGIPVKATLTFENVDPAIKIIQSLNIWIATSSEAGTKWHNPQFREVAIE
jgi:hypothetical protein